MVDTHAQSIRILGIPMDLGQQRRGVDMGPSAVRYADLYDRLSKEGHTVDDLGNLDVPVRDERSVRAHRWVEANGGGLRHLPEVIAACQAIYEEAKKCAGSDVLPLFLGGDHSIAIGTVAGMACSGPLGLLWVDAHGDFNTPETSPSGNIHGMPVATLLGRGVPDLVDLGHAGPKLRPHGAPGLPHHPLPPQAKGGAPGAEPRVDPLGGPPHGLLVLGERPLEVPLPPPHDAEVREEVGKGRVELRGPLQEPGDGNAAPHLLRVPTARAVEGCSHLVGRRLRQFGC